MKPEQQTLMNPKQPGAVLFLTALTDIDIPLESSMPACLLPLGHATFLECTLESLATAGITQVDLVLCEKPEDIRTVLPDGWRWGIELNWHLAQDSTTPYDIISHIAKLSTNRLIIGHADRWVSSSVIAQLIQSNLVSIKPNTHSDWSGWLSMSTEQASALLPHHDEYDWIEWIQKLESESFLHLKPHEFASSATTQELHDAQYVALSQPQLIPATWIRYPWGAASPDAIIHEKAFIEGPTLIGEHCNVGNRAQIGPGVVLSHDVLVAGGAIIRHTLVLPDTYISAGININDSVICGNIIASLKHSVTFRIPSKEGLLGRLHRRGSKSNRLPGQLLAFFLLLLCLPFVPLMLVWQKYHSRPAPWLQEEMVAGIGNNSALELVLLRLPFPHTGWCGWILGTIGGMIDILQARRFWIGIGPRNAAEWYALRKPWQTLFSHKKIGLLTPPGWQDDEQHSDDAQAASDAYLLVQIDLKRKIHLLWAIWAQFSLQKTIYKSRKPNPNSH